MTLSPLFYPTDTDFTIFVTQELHRCCLQTEILTQHLDLLLNLRDKLAKMLSMSSVSDLIWGKQPQIMSNELVQKTMPSAAPAKKPRSVYILVMGLTGAGKSTFISVITGNKDIPVGKAAEMDGGMKSLSRDSSKLMHF